MAWVSIAYSATFSLTLGSIIRETYDYRFVDARVDASLSPDLQTGYLDITPEVSQIVPDTVFKASLSGNTGSSTELIKEETVWATSTTSIHWELPNAQVRPWWPIGYGDQTMYQLRLELVRVTDMMRLAEYATSVSFRNAKVVQEKVTDAEGTTFLFEINGVRIFCGGSNWIPGDNFLTELVVGSPREGVYERWVQLLVEGNQNMLRVWAGGVYEHEALYK